MIDEAKEEYQENARPELKGFCEKLDDYDTIFLGFPNCAKACRQKVQWTF